LVIVVPKYLNYDVFSKDILISIILSFLLRSGDMNMCDNGFLSVPSTVIMFNFTKCFSTP